QLGTTPRGNTLERRRHLQHDVQRVPLPALGLLSRRVAWSQEGIDEIADRHAGRLFKPGGDPSPREPELLPAADLVGERELLREEPGQRGDARRVQRIAGARAEAVARDLPEEPFVVERA